MSQLYLETVTQTHLNVLRRAAQVAGITLVGGTALSLQMGHRKSYDLDWVTTEPVTSSLVDTFLSAISPQKLEQRLLSDTQYTAFVDDIKVTIFQDTAPLLHDTVSFQGARLAAIADIFSTKLFVLGKRNTWRDYVDIACCLRNNSISLQQGILESMQRYHITQKWILEPLVYFDDIEMIPIEWVREQIPESDIKNLLVKEVEDFIESSLV